MKKVNLTTATLAILAGVLTAPTITNAENSTETGTTIDAVEQVTTEAEEVEGEETSEEATQTGTTIDAVEQVNTKASEETSEEAAQDRGIFDELALIEQKNNATKEINEMTELSDFEKATYIAEIWISGAEGVEETLNAARDENQGRLDLAAAKEDAANVISGLQNLSDDEKSEFLGKVESATSVDEVNAFIDEAKAKDAENAAAKEDAYAYINSLHDRELLTDDQKDILDNQIKEATSIEELDAVKREAFEEGRANAIEYARRELEAGNINQGDFDFFESKYNELEYTGDMSDADAITAITAMMLDLIEARQAAENTLALYLADGWITLDQYNKFIERINEVHTAEEVLKLMDLIAMAHDNERPVDPMDPDNERPVDPTPPGDDNDGSTGGNNDGSTGGNNDGSTGGNNGGSTGGNNDGSTGGNNGGSTGGGNHNKPNTIPTSKPGSGNTSHSGGAASTGTASTGTASKGSAGQLPATGEEVRNGLIAGGLASVLGGAALFFRKPR